ncbi:MAG: OmpA family protein [Planktomarina sp.]
MRLSYVIFSCAAFVVAGAGAYFSAGIAVTWIEDSSVEAVTQRLVVQGHEWAGVQADGLQVILEGEAPTEADRFKALAAAGSEVEAARLIDNFSIEATKDLAPPSFSIEILRNSSGISLIGLIPTSSDKSDLLHLVSRIAGDLPVSDFLETADYPQPDTWPSSLSFGLLALEKLDRSKISVLQDRVKIEAIGDSTEQKNRLQAELARRTPADIRSEIFISSPLPIIAPFALRFTIDDGVAQFDACSTDSRPNEQLILEAATAAGFTGKNTCRLGLGVPSKRWGEAAAKSITALAKLGGGTLTITDADIALIVNEGTDAEAFDRVTSALDADLPEVFSLKSVLPQTVVASEGEGPPEFVITLSPEGQVQVRGPVKDELSRRAMETFARATFGSDQVLLATKLRDTLPRGWPVRTLAGLAALGELRSGIVTVGPDTVTVAGKTGSQTAGADISQILVDRLGNTTNFELDVEYVEALDPIASLLTSNECLAQVKELGDANKISFEPGSTTLDKTSRETVDAMSEILKRCLPTNIEIGGHTDSQGREEMNLSLSQNRADAVLNAFRLARVNMKTLTAIGYGESQPIADNGTEAGREANRRIEFKLTTPDDANQEPQDE